MRVRRSEQIYRCSSTVEDVQGSVDTSSRESTNIFLDRIPETPNIVVVMVTEERCRRESHEGQVSSTYHSFSPLTQTPSTHD